MLAAAPELEFRILGPLEVLLDGRELSIPRGKQRALLLTLLLRANETVPSDALVDALWGEQPPSTASVALQVHVSQLRKLLPANTVVTYPRGYALRVPPYALDLERFELLLGEARLAQSAEETATALRRALELWRGTALAEFRAGSLLRSEGARLEELRLTALEELIGAELELGLHAAVVAELEGLARVHPFRERLSEQLLLALYRCGRQADALETYQRVRTRLVEELGIEPGPALQQLHQQILRQDTALAPPAARDSERGVLVGRDGELAKLRGLAGAVLAGRGQTLLIAGESGIGKTRLAEETAAAAAARGALVVWGRSYEDEGPPPYWLWEQVLRRLGLQDSNVLAAGGELDRFRLFDEFATLLRSTAEQQPLVVVLDDLHWADPASLLALQFLARTIRSSRLLVIGTYRSTEVGDDHPFEPILRQLRRERLCDELHLRGLAADGIEALVRAAGADASLAGRLHDQTGGNPFFVHEILRNLAETGSTEIPQTVREVIAQRLARLSPACNELLTAAAVLGAFAEPVAARMLELDRPAVLPALDEAVTAGVLVEAGFGRYAFSHALLREALETGLDRVRRVELHRRAGVALETVYADDLRPRLGELAHHFAEAAHGGEGRRAIAYCRRAAAQAARELAYEQSAQQLSRALQLLELEESASRRERCDLLLELGEAYWRSGEVNRARGVFGEAAELARTLGDWQALARSASGYAGGAALGVTKQNDFLVELLGDAIAALPDDQTLLRARLQARLAEALIAYPDRAGDAVRLVEEAMPLARADSETAATVITSAHLVRWRHDRVATATELLELGRRLRNDVHLLHGLTWRIQANAELGDVEAIDRDLQEWEQIYERSPVPYFRWGLLLQQGMRALMRGDVAEGRRLAELTREVGEAHDNPNAARTFALQHVGIARAEGVTPELLRLMQATIDEHPSVAAWRAVLATLYARAGREDDARRELAWIGRHGFDAIPQDFLWPVALAYSAETAALLADGAAAAELAPLLEPVAHLHVVIGSALWDGAIARRQALLALVLGRPQEAEARRAAAIEAERSVGAQLAAAQTARDFQLVAHAVAQRR